MAFYIYNPEKKTYMKGVFDKFSIAQSTAQEFANKKNEYLVILQDITEVYPQNEQWGDIDLNNKEG